MTVLALPGHQATGHINEEGAGVLDEVVSLGERSAEARCLD